MLNRHEPAMALQRCRPLLRACLLGLALCAHPVGFAPAGPATAPAPIPIGSAKSTEARQFVYHPAGQVPAHMSLAGDFNGWSGDATPMTGEPDGSFDVTIDLPAGVHYYKFVADGKWITDPNDDRDLEVDDNYGGKNSAVMVGPDGRMLPPRRPDAIDAAAVLFSPDDTRDANVAAANLVRLSLRAQADDVMNATVLSRADKDGFWQRTPMAKAETKFGLDRFGTVVTPAGGGTLHYVFELAKEGAPPMYIAAGQAYTDADSAEAAAYGASLAPKFETPDWAKHAVWYQIFPERFRNGDPSNDPDKTQPWTSKWFSKLPGETGEMYHDVWARRYGGDIQGIRQELPYLKQLGINAIYLNPIFEAWDMHKYDTTDYRHVDQHFGFKGDIDQLTGETEDPSTWQWTKSDKLFLDFVADAHAQGFKVIIDGVFNHCGRRCFLFQDVLKNGKNSRFASWFDVYDWSPAGEDPFHYRAWDKDNGALPAFKKDPQLGLAHGPREFVMAITRRWLAPDGDATRGVDGVRLDAPEGIAHPFWTEYRSFVKSIKPDAYIDGEIWNWAQSYLQGDQYDAVMNYRFLATVQDFFVNQRTGISPSQFNTRCNELVYNYPFQAALVMQNLMDSHDTDRFASMMVNPDLPFDGANRIQDNGPNYNARKPTDQERARQKQAVAFQMMFVGAPMIYYGDETGMWSPDDPSNRQPMVWKDLQPYDDPEVSFNQDMFDWYQRLIAIRRQFPALQTGFFRPVNIDDARGVYAFARDLGDQHVYVVLNHIGDDRTVALKLSDHDSAYVDWSSNAGADVTVPADDRPTVSASTVSQPLNAAGGILQLPMKAWGTAVLTAR